MEGKHVTTSTFAKTYANPLHPAPDARAALPGLSRLLSKRRICKRPTFGSTKTSGILWHFPRRVVGGTEPFVPESLLMDRLRFSGWRAANPRHGSKSELLPVAVDARVPYAMIDPALRQTRVRGSWVLRLGRSSRAGLSQLAVVSNLPTQRAQWAISDRTRLCVRSTLPQSLDVFLVELRFRDPWVPLHVEGRKLEGIRRLQLLKRSLATWVRHCPIDPLGNDRNGQTLSRNDCSLFA